MHGLALVSQVEPLVAEHQWRLQHTEVRSLPPQEGQVRMSCRWWRGHDWDRTRGGLRCCLVCNLTKIRKCWWWKHEWGPWERNITMQERTCTTCGQYGVRSCYR